MALVNCAECNKEISDTATTCPGCGAPVSKAPPAKGTRVPYADHEVAVMLSKKKKTNHLLHLILSILTVGFWIVIWVLVAASNGSENARIDREINSGKKVR